MDWSGVAGAYATPAHVPVDPTVPWGGVGVKWKPNPHAPLAQPRFSPRLFSGPSPLLLSSQDVRGNLHPLPSATDLNLDLSGRDVEIRLLHHHLTQRPAQSKLKRRGLHHPPEGQLLVLELGSFISGLTTCARRPVDHPRPGVPLVLVLATFAASAEVLDVAVMDSYRQDLDSLTHVSRVGVEPTPPP